MPVVKIELIKGKSKEFKRIFMDTVHESLIETLKIPADDKKYSVDGL